MNKCTVKDRKQAARILAARENLPKVNADIIQRVGIMSDAEILTLLDNETPAAPVEVLQPGSVEEITPGGGSSMDLVYNALVDAANNYILSNNWDAEKISPLQWGAVCMACGRLARSRSWFRGIDENINTNNGIRQVNAVKGIDAAAVAGALPVWLELCNKYNKAPLKNNFLAFCGLDFQWLYDYRSPEGVNSARDELLKTLDRIQADGLRQRVLNPKESPIGAIFLLKADHGLVEASKVQHEYIKASETAAALPVFGSFDAITDENGQKQP